MHKISEGLMVALAAEVGMRIEVRGTGSPEWKRGFIWVDDSEHGMPIQHGRMSIQHGFYTHTKWHVQAYDKVCSASYYRIAWEYLIQTGYLIEQSSWQRVVDECAELAVKDYREKMENWGGRRKKPFLDSGHKFLPGLIPAVCELRQIINFSSETSVNV